MQMRQILTSLHQRFKGGPRMSTSV